VLASLRESMKSSGADALIVPSDDPHLSEYVASYFERRAFVSGFTGSAGTAVITLGGAYLWTDGRYFLQAEQELSSDWELMRSGTPGTLDPADWLAKNLNPGDSVMLDPFTYAASAADEMRSKLDARGVSLVFPGEGQGNPVDLVWGAARPEAPCAPLRVHPLSVAGKDVAEKLEDARRALEEAGADVLAVCALDEVAWLLNLRGGDVACNPVALSYLLVERDGPATLFVDGVKVTQEVALHLQAAQVQVAPYESAVARLARLCGPASGNPSGPQSVLYDPKRTPLGIQKAVPKSLRRHAAVSPIQEAKALKNPAEMRGMVEAHLRDGAAAAEFFEWLFRTVATGRPVSEVQVDREITARRKARGKFVDLSFPTIAGADANGAIVHYRAQEATCGQVTEGSMLLLDSGAQYEDGTTDVTRTVHLGAPSDVQRACFTRVLQGHISVDTAVFPEGTPGFVLDVLARKSLWSCGLDYGHGTGHGVGAALNVHEGPAGIAPRYGNTYPLKPGMVLSNEPGYYLPGKFGVRIENLLKVVPASVAGEGKEAKPVKGFLKFERLTHIPIQKSLIDESMLAADEVRWMDAYHADVWERISPLLQDKPEALAWLRSATRPLGES